MFQPTIIYIAVWCLCMAAVVNSQARVCLECYAKSGCGKMESNLVGPCQERCKNNLGYAYPGPDGCPDDTSRPEYHSNMEGFSYNHCMINTLNDLPECDRKYPCKQWQTESDYDAAQKSYDTEYYACYGIRDRNECDMSLAPTVVACKALCSVPCGVAKVQAEVDKGSSSPSPPSPPPPYRSPSPPPYRSPSPSPSRSPSPPTPYRGPSPSPSPYRGPSPSPSPYRGPSPPSDYDDYDDYDDNLAVMAAPAGQAGDDDDAEGSAVSGWSHAIYICIGGGFFLLLIIVLVCYLGKKNNQRRPPAQNQNQGYANQGYGFARQGNGHANAMVNPFYEFDEGSYNSAQQPPARKKASTKRNASTKKGASVKKGAPTKRNASTKKGASVKKGAPTKKKASTKGPKKGSVKGSVKKAKITVSLAAPFGIGLGGSDKSGIKVESLKEGRNAYKSGKIHVGMKIVSVNGNSTKGMVKEEVSELIRNCKGAGKVPVVFQAL